mmetsp:Transcript_22900/g.45640  ORF Transcript_22900/g.45640 Transcript_22900/m.45640 type:complete len:81 (-) Transcript_22900:413-655(-)
MLCYKTIAMVRQVLFEMRASSTWVSKISTTLCLAILHSPFYSCWQKVVSIKLWLNFTIYININYTVVVTTSTAKGLRCFL